MQTNPSTSNEQLWAALSWVPITPLFPLLAILALVMENTKSNPYVRHHAVQALASGVLVIVLTIFTLGLGSLLFLVFFYWAYLAYQGKTVEIPVVTNFVRKQGWIQ